MLIEIGHLRVALELDVDEQRQGLGAAREVAGEGDRGAELAERPRPGEREAARDAGQDERDPDRAQVAQVARTERAGHGLEAGVEPAHRSLDGEDVVGHGDEGLGEHDGHGRERDLDAEGRQVLADEPVAPPRHEQGDAADDGWQDEGHGEQRADPARRPVLGAREEPGQGSAEQQAQDGRHRGRRQREPQGRQDGRGREVGRDARPVGAEQQRDERHDEQQQGERRRHAERDARTPPDGIPHVTSSCRWPARPPLRARRSRTTARSTRPSALSR